MLQDSIIVRQRHERFLKNACETMIVWALENTEGFATSTSSEYDDNKVNQSALICFWSETALAKSFIKNDWSDFAPVPLSPEEFIENWRIGMSNDQLMVRTQSDVEAFDRELILSTFVSSL